MGWWKSEIVISTASRSLKNKQWTMDNGQWAKNVSCFMVSFSFDQIIFRFDPSINWIAFQLELIAVAPFDKLIDCCSWDCSQQGNDTEKENELVSTIRNGNTAPTMPHLQLWSNLINIFIFFWGLFYSLCEFFFIFLDMAIYAFCVSYFIWYPKANTFNRNEATNIQSISSPLLHLFLISFPVRRSFFPVPFLFLYGIFYRMLLALVAFLWHGLYCGILS